MRSTTDEGRAAVASFVAIASPSPQTEVGNSRLRVDPRSREGHPLPLRGRGNDAAAYNPNSFAICCFSLYFSTLLVGVTGSASTKRMCFGIM